MKLVEKIAKRRLLTDGEMGGVIVDVQREGGFSYGGDIARVMLMTLALSKAQDAKTAKAILSDPHIIEYDPDAELPINPYSATEIPEEDVGKWLGYHKALEDMADWVKPK